MGEFFLFPWQSHAIKYGGKTFDYRVDNILSQTQCSYRALRRKRIWHRILLPLARMRSEGTLVCLCTCGEMKGWPVFFSTLGFKNFFFLH